MCPEDMQMFLSIVQQIREGKLDRDSKKCFITGVLAGLNADREDIYQELSELPELFDSTLEDNVLDALIEQVEYFDD